MEGSTAVVVQKEKESFADLVRHGAGVEWPVARIAALNKLLPRDFQNDPTSAIALAIRAKRSGLDPFTQIHAWKNERGDLQFQTARDGFIEIASRDPHVESLEFQHVYEGESFEWRKDSDGKVHITHSGGLKKGELIGAYCCAHMVGERADHLEMRLVQDYRHLMKKSNWVNYLPDMLLTRVVSACVRLVCPASAGLYSEADFVLNESDTSKDLIRRFQEENVQGQVERIRGRLAAVEEDLDEDGWHSAPEPIEEPPYCDICGGLHEGPCPDEFADNVEDAQEEAYEEEPGEIESRYECAFCGEVKDSQQALAGHMRAHAEEKRTLEEILALDWPDPVDVARDDDGKWVVTRVATQKTIVSGDSLRVALKGARAALEKAETGEVSKPESAATVTSSAPSLSEIYRIASDNDLSANVVGRIVQDEFKEFKREGAVTVNPFDLDADARTKLLDLLKQQIDGYAE